MRAVSGAKPISHGAANEQGSPAPKPVRNRRRAERKGAFKQGVLISSSGEEVQIVLKNLSETGARVDFFRGGSAIVGRAVLSVPTLGLKRNVRIAWKDQNSAGLEFVD
jgi:hypothetical protein